MTDPTRPPGDSQGVRQGGGWPSLRALWILAVVFSVAAAGALVLVAVDLAVGRPAAGDVFIAFLNGMAAVVLWVGAGRRKL